MTGERGGSERHRARESALQLLYQWEVGRLTPAAFKQACALYWESHPAPASRRRFAERLVEGTVGSLDGIDPVIEANAQNWRLSRMAVVDRLILRLAVYELVSSETPAAVVINEALELAKTFGGDQTARFVNGVLDSVSRTCKAPETEAADR